MKVYDYSINTFVEITESLINNLQWTVQIMHTFDPINHHSGSGFKKCNSQKFGQKKI